MTQKKNITSFSDLLLICIVDPQNEAKQAGKAVRVARGSEGQILADCHTFPERDTLKSRSLMSWTN
ncbi:MAG: hypothetical protein PHU66_09010 [Bacteroidaceae bacterium]|nr:hypothetical protein [Bacteroidaceae bacterium]